MRKSFQKAKSSDVAKTLIRSAEILKEQGWTPYSNSKPGGMCALQALAVAVNERSSTKGLWYGSRDALADHLGLGDTSIGTWNDSQTEDTVVIEAFQTAAHNIPE